MLGEVENITPGLTRTFHVEVAEPGTYTTACKPGMKGDGIRGDFTVTGATAAAKDADQKLTEAVESYQTLRRRAGRRAARRAPPSSSTAVKAGKVEEAKTLYPVARGPLGAHRAGGGVLRRPRPDDRRPRGRHRRGHGVHRLPPPREGPLGRRPPARHATRSPTSCSPTSPSSSPRPRPSSSTRCSSPTAPRPCSTRSPPARSPARRTATATPTSGTSRRTSTGSKAAIDALRPALQERDPRAASTTIDARFKALDDLLETAPRRRRLRALHRADARTRSRS